MVKRYIHIADASQRKQPSAQDMAEDEKIEAALGCGSCTAQSKDCMACSAELRRKVFAPQA